ncbi:zinc finger protein 585B-like isoform X1 [Pararge aegeria]|uniref:zinc finger protein 585B-like isoform X1 n=1 Tax=Pararge aegeria TaxID=116150 RepID=UPI0019D2F05C|nr:zinc finger protein 585B-like isoform X1 [Pararge aegeria]
MNCSKSNHDQNTQNNNRNLLFHLHEDPALEDFLNVCRICATIADEVCPIFYEHSQCDDIAGKINQYLPIKVSKEDGLPQVICVQCQSTILAWDELVKCSVQANMVLQQKLSVMRLLDPEKAEEEIVESTKPPIETTTHAIFNFNDEVRTLLADYFDQLKIDKENADLEYVCQFCANYPTSKSIEELTDHLKSIHGTELQTKQSVKDFVRDNITFEEALIMDKDDSDVESARNEPESGNAPKELKLQDYCCPFCESVFSSPSRLVYHLNKHIEISIANGIVCCELLYENKLSFVAHLQDVHVSRMPDKNTCKSCGKISSDFDELQAHINEDHPESNDFNEPKTILHVGTRQKYIPVNCPKCNKTFSNKYNLRVHDLRSHLGEQSTFTCDKCNKSYKSQGSLNYHHKIYHEGILKYLCSLCGEAFPTRGTRNIHARIHTGAKPFECYHCGKSYRAKNTLHRHMDMHLDIRNYACSLCPKKFRKRTHLNSHLRTHEKKPK